jgi:pyrrolidone-carboxylate peptidase
MSRQKTNILITGFGPFPGTSDNPSGYLAKAIAKAPLAIHLADVEISSEVLPTDWQKITQSLNTAFDRYRPNISLHLGYAQTSPGFQFETTAYNQTCNNKDVTGVAGSCQPICTNAPTQLATTLPLNKLTDQLSAHGLNATSSDDPGRYLCNMAYYLSLNRSPACASLFIHIPAIKTDKGLIPGNHEGSNQLSLEEARRGMEVIVEALVN